MTTLDQSRDYLIQTIIMLQHNWVVLAMGEKWIVTTVLVVSQFAIGVVAYLSMNHKRLSQVQGGCNPVSDPQYDFNPLILHATVFAIVLSEMGIYADIYYYIHQMDMEIKPHISEQEQRRRKRRRLRRKG